MTLDEAIKHCEEVIKEKKDMICRMNKYDDLFEEERQECSKCLKDHEQLAEWLTQLKLIKEAYKTGEVMNIVAECMSIWGE